MNPLAALPELIELQALAASDDCSMEDALRVSRAIPRVLEELITLASDPCVIDDTPEDFAGSVIFGDIDGVLNHPAVYKRCAERPGQTTPVDWLDPTLVRRLADFCEVSGARLVVTSGWRRYLKGGLAELRTVLSAAGFDRELGATPLFPVLNDRGRALVRWTEIGLWLEAHPNVTRWVILDDQPVFGAPLDPVVRVNGEEGLQAHHFRAVVTALSVPRSYPR